MQEDPTEPVVERTVFEMNIHFLLKRLLIFFLAGL